ncbi:MAG TPA: hypothetical protein VFK80_07150 [Limnochordia bacterium]|nr:hypothetical protein [Limnochordia bacterium]
MRSRFSLHLLKFWFPLGIFLLMGFLDVGAASPKMPAAGDPCPSGLDVAAARALAPESIEACVKARLSALHDVSLTLSGELQTSADSGTLALRLRAQILPPNLLRYEIDQPDSMAGLLQILDKEAGTFATYYPVSNTVVTGPIDRLQGQAALPIDVSQVMSLPPAEAFDVSVVGAEPGATAPLLEVQAAHKALADAPVLRFWFDTGDWLLTRMTETTAAGLTRIDIRLSDVQLDAGLTRAALTALPAGAQVRHI